MGPKLCNYDKAVLEANTCTEIESILTASNGCAGIVKKTRQLYMIGQTRVHIDDVEGLGHFLELEVCNNITRIMDVSCMLLVHKLYIVITIVLGSFNSRRRHR